MFDDWMERYEYIIELGKNLLIKEEFKTENNLIKGCQSKCGCKANKPKTK
jgi:cysteine desulfuration protein SufE